MSALASSEGKGKLNNNTLKARRCRYGSSLPGTVRIERGGIEGVSIQLPGLTRYNLTGVVFI